MPKYTLFFAVAFQCLVLGGTECGAADPVPAGVVMTLGENQFCAQCDHNGPMALSSRGRFLAMKSSVPGVVDIFTLKDGALWGSVVAVESEFGGDLAFSTDEAWLAMADGVRTVIVWNVWTRREVCRWELETAKSVAFGPGNEWIAIGGKQSVELRSFPNGKSLGFLTTADVNYPSVKVSADGKRLLAWPCHSTTLKSQYALWNIDDRKLLASGAASTYNESTGHSIRAVSDDLAMLVTGWKEGRGASVQSVSLPTGEQNRWPNGVDRIWPNEEVAIVGNRGTVLCQTSRAHPRIEEYTFDGRPTGRSVLGFECPLRLLRASQDESVLIGRSDNRCWVFDLPSLRLRAYCRGPGSVVGLAFAKRAKIVATMGTHGSVSESVVMDDPAATTDEFDAIRFWSSTTGKMLHAEPGWNGPLISSDGEAALVWKNDGHLRWIDLESFGTTEEAWISFKDQKGMVMVRQPPHRSSQVWVSELHSTENLNQIAFQTSREGIGHTSRISIWNRGTDRVQQVSIRDPDAPHSAIAAVNPTLSRDGSILAFTGIWSLDEAPFREDRIGIWKTASDEAVEWLSEDDGNIVSLVISDDSKTLAAVSAPMIANGSDSLQVWDLSSRRKQVYAHSPAGRAEESDGVLNEQIIPLAISPDGEWIAVGGSNGRIDLWSRKSKAFTKSFVGHRGPVWSVAFSPDGTRLATGGRDGMTLIWKWPLE